MSKPALPYLGAAALIQAYQARRLSPPEVVSALLRRAEASAAAINAVTYIDAESATARALEAERRYHDGSARTLEGVPVAIKEETAVSGWSRTSGSLLTCDTPDRHHPIVDKLIAAGAIPLVQTTVPEFCLIGQTHSLRFGVTRNPWNREVTPGGSSGGSAAALAAGLAPLATGSDMGGSTRIPAALCGVYGYKPPFGCLPPAPGEELFAFASEGPMARSLDDLLLMYEVIRGPHPATFAAVPPIPLRIDESIAGLRLAVAFDAGAPVLCPDTWRHLENACNRLLDAGAHVERIDLNWDSAEIGETLYRGIFGIFFAEYLATVPGVESDRATPYLRWIAARFRSRAALLPAAELAAELHSRLQQTLWGRGVAALLCPTVFSTEMPASLDPSITRAIDIEGSQVDSFLGWLGTPAFNLLNRYPALSVPTGRAVNGVPTALQIIAPPFKESTVFSIAHALDRSDDHGLYTQHFPS